MDSLDFYTYLRTYLFFSQINYLYTRQYECVGSIYWSFSDKNPVLNRKTDPVLKKHVIEISAADIEPGTYSYPVVIPLAKDIPPSYFIRNGILACGRVCHRVRAVVGVKGYVSSIV